eukprot:GHRR01033382.1.p1 GENE.GHRR01033382.1~~GHRR01033382.1.p1  ORF type:complete len:131 (+),score=14.62 GHRR01033382.1:136-528(+)
MRHVQQLRSATVSCDRPLCALLSIPFAAARLSCYIRASMAAAAAPQPLLHGDAFFLDDFAVRQWTDPNYSGTRIQYDMAEFVLEVHKLYKQQGCKLVDGYAPFCKHVFVPNFVGECLHSSTGFSHLGPVV